ncbi:MAG TPA: DNA polymerase III subunit delta' [Ktedonobacterales bacterium]|nr:DNA polymerase III subunit delta' [Ktedonobacterales bacterium]
MRGVVGNRHAQSLLERAVLTDSVSHAYLLTGPESIGKTTLALAFATLLLCQNRAPDSVEACGECVACRKMAHGTHPDVEIVKPAKDKKTIGVDVVREALRLVSLTPTEGHRRIYIIPDMDSRMPIEHAEAASALLKTLEEPASNVVMLLTAVEMDRLLPTILSRCQLVPMQPIAPEEITQALERQWGVAPAEAQKLAALASGRLGWAVAAHEHPERSEQRAELLTQIVGLTSATRDERIKRAATLASDGQTARQTLDLWTLWWRDVTLAACGAQARATTGDARAQAERQGRALGPARAQTFMQALLAAQLALEQNGAPRLTMENLLLALPTVR